MATIRSVSCRNAANACRGSRPLQALTGLYGPSLPYRSVFEPVGHHRRRCEARTRFRGTNLIRHKQNRTRHEHNLSGGIKGIACDALDKNRDSFVSRMPTQFLSELAGRHAALREKSLENPLVWLHLELPHNTEPGEERTYERNLVCPKCFGCQPKLRCKM